MGSARPHIEGGKRMILRPYQVEARDRLLGALVSGSVAVDASDTGTGKTYVAAGVLAARACSTDLVVCPKSLIPTWQRVCGLFGMDVPTINYERLVGGRTDFIRRRPGSKRQYEWLLPSGSLVIFDEAHRCGGINSYSSVVCALTKAFKLKTLLVSATLADNPTKMRALGYLFGLFEYRYASFLAWALKNGCYRNRFRGLEFSRNHAAATMVQLHELIFPRFGVRVRVDDIPDFPANQVDVLLCDVSEPREVDAAYELLASMEQSAMTDRLVAQLRARQKIEFLKVPVLLELAQDFLAEGKSVVVFVNFRDTVERITARLKGCCIHGGQSAAERQANIDRFQSNQARVMVCTLGAGGVGLSLHDEHGGFPRVSLINPSFNAVELKQALGRIHRVTSKSPAIQRIVLAAGTVESRIRDKVATRLHCFDLLNDGDLSPSVLEMDVTDV